MRHCRGGSRPAPRPVCPSLSCFDSSFYPSQLLFFNRTEGRPPRDAWDCVVPAQHGPAPCTAVVRTEAGTCRSPAAGIACTGSSHRPASREPRRGRFVVVFFISEFCDSCVSCLGMVVCVQRRRTTPTPLTMFLLILTVLLVCVTSPFCCCCCCSRVSFSFLFSQVSRPRSQLQHPHLHPHVPLLLHLHR